MLDKLFTQGAFAYHFGNAADMCEVLETAPADVICMGNIDPAACFAKGTAESVKTAAARLMSSCGKYKNFIPSSGCDIPAKTRWDNINSFFEGMKE